MPGGQGRCRCWPAPVAAMAYEGHGAKPASSKPWGVMLTCVKPKCSQCGESAGGVDRSGRRPIVGQIQVVLYLT